MTALNIDTVIVPGDEAELVEYPDDQIWLRLAAHGDIQVADYTSTDRDGPPAHSHPWDEVQIVVDGYVEFSVGGGDWTGGGSGTVQLLPRGSRTRSASRPAPRASCRCRSVRPTTRSRAIWPDCSRPARRSPRSPRPPATTA